MAKGKYKRKRLAKAAKEKVLLKDLNLSADVIEILETLQITNVYELLRSDKDRIIGKGDITESQWDEIVSIVNSHKQQWSTE